MASEQEASSAALPSVLTSLIEQVRNPSKKRRSAAIDASLPFERHEIGICKEIAGSLSSHPAMPYKLKDLTIDEPGKINKIKSINCFRKLYQI